MEVILLETFDRLGKIGDIVKVKNGYARNFLIPQKKALRANKENKEIFLKIKNDLIEKNKKFIDDSKQVLKKIENKEIIFIRNASDNGQLYGSVSPKDIANYFSEKKIDIKPSNINLHTSIKKIGIYDLNIKLHADVGCNLKINVATSEQNANQQKVDLENLSKKKNKDSNSELKKTISASETTTKHESQSLHPPKDKSTDVESDKSAILSDSESIKIESKDTVMNSNDKEARASKDSKKGSKTKSSKDLNKEAE